MFKIFIIHLVNKNSACLFENKCNLIQSFPDMSEYDFIAILVSYSCDNLYLKINQCCCEEVCSIVKMISVWKKKLSLLQIIQYLLTCFQSCLMHKKQL